MAGKNARIDSPEILKELRRRFVEFDQTCKNAVLACEGDVRAVQQWLAGEQQTHLKLQLRKCDEAVNLAQREYSQARWSATDLSRSSGMEEKRALDKAKRRKEEVEAKLKAVQKWAVLLDDKVGKLLRPVTSLAIQLETGTPQALSRLDRMLDHLEDYLRPEPPPEGP